MKAANESLFVEELLEIEKRRREPEIFYQKAESGIAHEIHPYYFWPMNTISLKLPDHLLERLEAASRARGTTKSSLVRECLEQSLDARPIGSKATCYDLASDLAGSLKGLPRDLATNPKYMEGFGQ
jgi:predicted transcriptional regulator